MESLPNKPHLIQTEAGSKSLSEAICEQDMFLDIKDKSASPRLADLRLFFPKSPLISTRFISVRLMDASRYYCTPLRDIFRIFLPPGIRKGMAPKEQLFVMRGKIQKKNCGPLASITEKKPAQATIFEAMLPVKKGMLLSELLEKTKGSAEHSEYLGETRIIIVDTVRIDRSPSQ